MARYRKKKSIVSCEVCGQVHYIDDVDVIHWGKLPSGKWFAHFLCPDSSPQMDAYSPACDSYRDLTRIDNRDAGIRTFAQFRQAYHYTTPGRPERRHFSFNPGGKSSG